MPNENENPKPIIIPSRDPIVNNALHLPALNPKAVPFVPLQPSRKSRKNRQRRKSRKNRQSRK